MAGHSKAVEPEFIEVDGQRITYELIHQDVSKLLNVTPGGKEVFVRWDLPIRYYVEGLENYPEKAKLFDRVAQEMSELTGHDIQRHHKIYWPSNKTMFHPDSPDNRFTNANFFFYSDFESLSKSDYIKAAKLLGSSLEKERKLIFKFNKKGDKESYIFKFKKGNKKPYSKSNFSGSAQSLMYFNSFKAYPYVDDMTYSDVLGSWINTISPLTNEIRSLLFSDRKYRRYNGNVMNLFDQLFLSTYYRTELSQSEDELKHGINNEKAAKMIAKEMWYQYQQHMAQ